MVLQWNKQSMGYWGSDSIASIYVYSAVIGADQTFKSHARAAPQLVRQTLDTKSRVPISCPDDPPRTTAKQ